MLCGFLHVFFLFLLRYSKFVWRLLYQSLLLLSSFKTACAISATGICAGARCLFASGFSLCWVVLLVAGAVVDDDVANDDEVGVAAGFGV